jgi:hypothetical protein
MATLPEPIIAGGYTIEYLACLLQPHHSQVLYVLDGIMYVERNIGHVLASMKFSNTKLQLVDYHDDKNFTYWILRDSNEDLLSTHEWWFFRRDVVDALLEM